MDTRIQLAKEVEKVNKLQSELAGRKAANDVLRAENRGLFEKCEALNEANSKYEIVILEGKEAVDRALLDEREELQQRLIKTRRIINNLIRFGRLKETLMANDCGIEGFSDWAALKATIEDAEALLGSEQL